MTAWSAGGGTEGESETRPLQSHWYGFRFSFDKLSGSQMIFGSDNLDIYYNSLYCSLDTWTKSTAKPLSSRGTGATRMHFS